MADDKNGYERTQRDDESNLPLLVQVTAPATLPSGYTFEALLNDDPERPFTAEVPDGGVQEGEKFLCPVPRNMAGGRINAPTGHWKDGLFDCFSEGICHPHLWCAFFCSKIAMAQVMTRMQLTWLGEPGPYAGTRNTFRVVVALFVSYILYTTSLQLASMDYEYGNVPTLIIVLKFIGSILYGIWSLYSLCKTRESIRNQYSIPEKYCHGYEDCCCAFWCTCCALSQMARHTGEYETYPGTCCTTTGHPAGTPLTV